MEKPCQQGEVFEQLGGRHQGQVMLQRHATSGLSWAWSQTQADMCYSPTNHMHACLLLLGNHGIAWQAIFCCSTACRVFIDVTNEPDSMGIKWEPSSGHPGARELYLETLDALHSMVPEGLLYILEGAHSNASLACIQ